MPRSKRVPIKWTAACRRRSPRYSAPVPGLVFRVSPSASAESSVGAAGFAGEGDDHVFVAGDELTGQTIRRRHVVDFGILDLGGGDAAERLERRLFLIGQVDRHLRLAGEILDLDQAGAAI